MISEWICLLVWAVSVCACKTLCMKQNKKKMKKKVRKCVTFTERKQTSSYIQKDAGNICYGNLIWNYWCGCMTVGLIWRRRCSHTFTWVILVKIKKRESQTKCQTSKQYELIANLKQIFFLNFRIHIYEPTTKINEKERKWKGEWDRDRKRGKKTILKTNK